MLILRWDGEIAHEQPDELVDEEPLEIRIQNRAISVTMRTRGHDVDLAAGFLLTEGIIHRQQDVISIKHCTHNQGHNVLNVVLAPGVSVDFRRLTRHLFASSSCGLCGKATIESVHGQFPSVRSDIVIDAELLATLPEKMRAAQATFERTGGLHAAALFDPAGRLIVLREDVGRHNAVDKVVGRCLLYGQLPLDEHVLVVSGRSSFEIMQKALAARVPVVAAVSAPSSLAVEFAEESGQTLIGFLRDHRMNVYSHPHRITFGRIAKSHLAQGKAGGT
jgi:FdhD protein